MGVLETVKIVSKTAKDGYIIINKSDLTNKDKIFKEEEKVAEKEKGAIEEVVAINSKRRKETK